MIVYTEIVLPSTRETNIKVNKLYYWWAGSTEIRLTPDCLAERDKAEDSGGGTVDPGWTLDMVLGFGKYQHFQMSDERKLFYDQTS